MTARLDGLDGRAVVVGAGIAGLATALFLAPEPVVLLARAPLGNDGASPLAQGGMAACVGADDDVERHLADTLAAGDGLCDAAVARAILSDAPDAIAALARLGTRFDRDRDGRLALGLEAAHSRRRIVHADGDGTGREVVRALAAAVRACPSVTVVEGVEARRLLVEEGAVCGLLVAGAGAGANLHTSRVVLATGGIGALFAHTTNPASSFGAGLALAARAGAVLADIEFVQFHPTALAAEGTGEGPLPLVSEAVRGEGAVLVNGRGERFLAEGPDAAPGAELAPRDVVARAVWRQMAAGQRVFLDARTRPGAAFASRFPAILAACRAIGVDPAAEPVPIRPAAHYHMGGIAVDGAGRSSVDGLWAVGEVAATGLHGANRLASNSLVEAVVCARHAAASIAAAGGGRRAVPRLPAEMPPTAQPAAVRPLVSRHLGVMRDAAGLRQAIGQLMPMAEGSGAAADPALVGFMMAAAALARTESRGAHSRTDFPHPGDLRRTRLTLDDARAAARRLTTASAA